MRTRLPLGIAAITATLLAAAVQIAAAGEPSRLTALSQRHSLRDAVCIAMADGRISSTERGILFAYAKPIMKAEEYEGFKRSVNRLSPPPAKNAAKMAKKNKKPSSTRIVQKKSPTGAVEVSDGPRKAVVADRVAAAWWAR